MVNHYSYFQLFLAIALRAGSKSFFLNSHLQLTVLFPTRDAIAAFGFGGVDGFVGDFE